MIALVKLAGVLRKAGDRFLRAYSLSQTQFNVLMVLRYEVPEGCTQSELCRRLLVKGANMTGLMRRMEARRLLVREADPDDERAWRVRVTEKGRKLLQRVESIYYRRIDRIMAVHSKLDLERFARGLSKTQEALAREAL